VSERVTSNATDQQPQPTPVATDFLPTATQAPTVPTTTAVPTPTVSTPVMPLQTQAVLTPTVLTSMLTVTSDVDSSALSHAVDVDDLLPLLASEQQVNLHPEIMTNKLSIGC